MNLEIGDGCRLKGQEGTFKVVELDLPGNHITLQNTKTMAFAHVSLEDIEGKVGEDQWNAFRTMGE